VKVKTKAPIMNRYSNSRSLDGRNS